MRLATLRTADGPHAAVQLGDRFIDLAAADPGLPAGVRGLLAAGADALAAARRAAERATATIPAATVKLGPPVPDPGKIVCLGLNYRDHALESGKAIPAEPV